MIDNIYHGSSLAWRYGHLVPLLDPPVKTECGQVQRGALFEALPDSVLKDVAVLQGRHGKAAAGPERNGMLLSSAAVRGLFRKLLGALTTDLGSRRIAEHSTLKLWVR